jgi:hypothetical protein
VRPLLIIILLSLIFSREIRAQYPFEKFPAASFQKFGTWDVYDRVEDEGKIHWVMKLPAFYKDSSSITVQITTFSRSSRKDARFKFSTRDTCLIRIYRNEKQVQLIREPFPVGTNFGMLDDFILCGDINGDSLPDLKITAFGGGTGLAMLFYRIIYLFQREDGTFSKTSFVNMELIDRPERDLDGDGNYEIVTTGHTSFEDHSYWVFNVYRFEDRRLHCVNDAFNYPIMIQHLYKINYRVTDRISRDKMKDFACKVPDEFNASY